MCNILYQFQQNDKLRRKQIVLSDQKPLHPLGRVSIYKLESVDVMAFIFN